MIIRGDKLNHTALDQIQHESGASKAHAVSGSRETTNESSPSTDTASDVVEVSKRSQAFSSDKADRTDVIFARRALLSFPPLTDDRIEELQRRIKEDYYQQPNVIKSTAQKVVEGLGFNSAQSTRA